MIVSGDDVGKGKLHDEQRDNDGTYFALVRSSGLHGLADGSKKVLGSKF